MNSKIIAAGVVVALCAVALIGVGYAYTAETTSNNNVISSNYVTIKAGTGVEALWDSDKNQFKYNTVTTGANQFTFTAIAEETISEKQIVIAKSGNIASDKVNVTMEFSIGSLTEAQKKLFTDGTSAYAIVKLGTVSGNAEVSGNTLTYTFENVDYGSHALSITPRAVSIENVDSVPNFTLSLKFNVTA